MKRYVSYVLMLCVVCAAGLSGCKKGAVSLNSGDASPEGPSIAEVRSEKKDLSKYLVKYYLPAKAEVSSGAQVVIEESSDPFSIVDFGPQDELPAEVRKPSVYVLFSQPVIPLKMLGEPAKESPYISIEPPIKGVYRWYGTRLLSFDADEEALPQRLYTVTVKDSVKSLGGKSLTGVKSFSFRTEYLSVREFLPGGPDFYGSTDDVPLEDARNITLRFSYPVNLGVIKDYLSVRSGGRQLPFELSQPQKEGLSDYDRSRTVLLSLRETPPENTSVEVLLKEGARSEADYIGTPKDALFSFSTLKPFTYSYFDIYSYSYPGSADADSNPVYLTFSHPVREEGLAQFISTLPPMPIASENLSVWNNIVKISNLPVSFGSKYAVKVSGGLTDAYGRQLGRDQSIDIEVPPPGSYAYFPNTGTRILEAQFPPKIVYEFQNIDDGDYKFAPYPIPTPSSSQRNSRPTISAECRGTRGTSRSSICGPSSTRTERDSSVCPGISSPRTRTKAPRLGEKQPQPPGDGPRHHDAVRIQQGGRPRIEPHDRETGSEGEGLSHAEEYYCPRGRDRRPGSRHLRAQTRGVCPVLRRLEPLLGCPAHPRGQRFR
jgi:hypothetical protein